MEGSVQKAGRTEFKECFNTMFRNPYVLRLALSASIGGLLFGYDTGVISGALLYIRDDFKSVGRHTWLQESRETIVGMTGAGAVLGAAFGGWFNDKYGRKKSILLSDIVFILGAIVMAAAPKPWIIIIGRILVGLGVGMTSMASPLYISEASPANVRGALVSMNGLFLTGGQFLAYLINLALTKVPGTWRWMLAMAGVPALIQFGLMFWLPESPRWLFRQDKVAEARAIMENIYPANEVDDEMRALQSSIETEKEEEKVIGEGLIPKLKSALGNAVVRRGLYAGVTVQVAQQFAGINTVMYYSPTIVQLAGFASNRTALALALITTGLNSLGSIISMAFVDRYGRRRMMLISISGIICCLFALSMLFFQASAHSPAISTYESTHFGVNSTCPSFQTATNARSWNCMTCLKESCAFCANGVKKYLPGACVAASDVIKGACHAEERTWYTKGCPSKFGFFAVLLLGLYIISYSPGMGTGPWLLNAEIYPLRYRGVGGGIAAVANWVSNLTVSETFLTLTEALGSAGTFLLFAGFSTIGLVAIYFLVPETKGLPFEQIEKVLQKGYRPSLCSSKEQQKDVDHA